MAGMEPLTPAAIARQAGFPMTAPTSAPLPTARGAVEPLNVSLKGMSIPADANASFVGKTISLQGQAGRGFAPLPEREPHPISDAIVSAVKPLVDPLLDRMQNDASLDHPGGVLPWIRNLAASTLPSRSAAAAPLAPTVPLPQPPDAKGGKLSNINAARVGMPAPTPDLNLIGIQPGQVNRGEGVRG
jgi:hypothetical protein